MKTIKKLTTLLVVDDIDQCLPVWAALGYSVSVRVPDTGTLEFVILQGANGSELMLQTRSSLAGDLPAVSKRKPAFLLYADVSTLAEARKALPDAKVLLDERKTFYAATESWVELEDGVILGLSER